MKTSTLKKRLVHTLLVVAVGFATLTGIAVTMPKGGSQVPVALADGCDGGINPPPGYDCPPTPTPTPTQPPG